MVAVDTDSGFVGRLFISKEMSDYLEPVLGCDGEKLMGQGSEDGFILFRQLKQLPKALAHGFESGSVHSVGGPHADIAEYTVK